MSFLQFHLFLVSNMSCLAVENLRFSRRSTTRLSIKLAPNYLEDVSWSSEQERPVWILPTKLPRLVLKRLYSVQELGRLPHNDLVLHLLCSPATRFLSFPKALVSEKKTWSLDLIDALVRMILKSSGLDSSPKSQFRLIV